MLLRALLLGLTTCSTLLCHARSLSRQATVSNVTVFNPPTLKPFIHVDLLVGYPVNVSTVYGLTGRAPNLGGNITGAINGQILKIGAAIEILPPAANGSVSFYTNQWSINTTEAGPILMDAKAVITYANNALHGFGTISFATGSEQYPELNYNSYVAEFEANFDTGKAIIDVFEVASAGHADGSPVRALLPPG